MDLGQESFIVMDTNTHPWSRAPEIRLPRLEKYLRVEKFKQPPIQESGDRLTMQRFPTWLFCPSCRRMYRWGREQEVESSGDLPRCATQSCRKSILVPMRYVAVCRNGHVSDVDWFKWAHSDPKTRSEGSCDARHQQLKFTTQSHMGSSLEALRIECERCGAYRSLQDLSQSNALARAGQKCTGRQPWQRRQQEEVNCDAPLKALLRSQTAVHFSDLKSALDVTTGRARRDQAFDDTFTEVVRNLEDFQGFSQPSDYEPSIDRIAQQIGRRIGREVTIEELRAALAEHYSQQAELSEGGLGGASDEAEDLLLDEWPALTTPTEDRTASSQLIVDSSDWPGEGDGSGELSRVIKDVYLIERLREVRAMQGFRRLEPDAELVSPNLARGGPPTWLPAIEVFGEGIFLEFHADALAEWEQSEKEAINHHLSGLVESLESAEGLLGRFEPLLPVLPRFIMVHTFSHVLMRQLCYESGYGGASIRERLYVFPDRAGLLIYTADGDSEGSLGGLVRQGRADRLKSIVLSTLERATWCSNDPICMEMPQQGLGGLNRAACHACALAPETSCDYLNSLLDRKLLIGDGAQESVGEGELRGYFQGLLGG